jgi:tight adherence protein B
MAQWLNRYLSRQDFVRRLRLDLVRAGIEIKPTQFFLLRLIIALTAALVARLFTASLPWWQQLAAMLAGGAAGYLLVRPYLGYRQRRRVAAFEKSLADALDVMVGALESGSSLSGAVELVSREMPVPLSAEFARVLRDAGLGLSYEDAFKGLHERVPSDDVGMLVSAVSIQFRVGGNLAEVLKTLGMTVRERARIRGEIKTLTAQQKITSYIITAMPFFLVGFLFVISRNYMLQLFEPGLQRVLAVSAVVLVGVGNVLLRRVLAIEV